MKIALGMQFTDLARQKRFTLTRERAMGNGTFSFIILRCLWWVTVAGAFENQNHKQKGL